MRKVGSVTKICKNKSWQEASLVCIILQNTTTQEAVKARGAGAQNAWSQSDHLQTSKELWKTGAKRFHCYFKNDNLFHTSSLDRTNAQNSTLLL